MKHPLLLAAATLLVLSVLCGCGRQIKYRCHCGYDATLVETVVGPPKVSRYACPMGHLTSVGSDGSYKLQTGYHLEAVDD